MAKTVSFFAFAGAFLLVLLHMLPAIENSVPRLHAEPSGAQTGNAFLLAAAAHEGKPLALGQRTATSGCRARGPLPDPACTPGAIFPDANPGKICEKGYTQAVRNVSVAAKRAVYAEYGLSYPQASGAYEVDHLIPLELGGSNDIANLYPEAAKPIPGFHEKDLVENYLHQKTCNGEAALAYAQQVIATNWLEVWNALTPEEIAALKAEY